MTLVSELTQPGFGGCQCLLTVETLTARIEQVTRRTKTSQIHQVKNNSAVYDN
jgi:hypothetical protein